MSDASQIEKVWGGSSQLLCATNLWWAPQYSVA